METRRVFHDFSELDYDDIFEARPRFQTIFSRALPLIFAALAVGLILGSFNRRK